MKNAMFRCQCDCNNWKLTLLMAAKIESRKPVVANGQFFGGWTDVFSSTLGP